MRFLTGKYKDKSFEEVWEIDSQYLFWVADNLKESKLIPVNLLKEWLAPKREAYDSFNKTRATRVSEILTPVITVMRAHIMKRTLKGKLNNSWLIDVLEKLERGESISPRCQEIIIDTAAHTKGRRNSTAYQEAFNRYTELFSLVRELPKFSSK